MKLTAKWKNDEGTLSAADVARLLDNPTIAEADFLQDMLCDVAALYQDVLDKVIPGRTRASFYGMDVSPRYRGKRS